MRIHHNTVVGSSCFANVLADANGTTFVWQPEIFDNLCIASPEGSFINEQSTKLRDSHVSSFSNGGAGTIKSNVYLAGLLVGGTLRSAAGYDLSAGVTISNNLSLAGRPVFLSETIGDPEYYQLLEPAYPWVVGSAWTGDGEYPAYVGAVPPGSSGPGGDPFLSEITMTHNSDGSYTLAGSLVQGSAEISAIMCDRVFPLSGGSSVSAPYPFERTFSVGSDLDTDAMYSLSVVAEGSSVAATQTWSSVLYTGEIYLFKAKDASERKLDPGAFVVLRADTPAATRLPITIRYSISGDALAGADYEELSGEVTIPEGASSASIMVKPILNTDSVADKTLTLTLDAENYEVADARKTATLTIKNFTVAVGDIYVDANVSDPDSNGTIERPFQTIADGLWAAMSYGDTVWVFSSNRTYSITGPTNAFDFEHAGVTLRPYEDGGLIDIPIDAGFATEAGLDSPEVIHVIEGATNVTICGVHFRYTGDGQNKRGDNSLGRSGHILLVAGDNCTIDACRFSYEGIIGAEGGSRIIMTKAGEHTQRVGYAMTIRNCVFENIQSTATPKYVLELSAKPMVVGNVFSNCCSAVSALKGNSELVSVISNRFYDCKAIRSNGTGNYGEFSQGEIAYNIFFTTNGEPFIIKGPNGLNGNDGKVKIHHNTVVGGPLARVINKDGSGDKESQNLPGWAPWIFGNLVLADDSVAPIMEMSTAGFKDANYKSSFQTITTLGSSAPACFKCNATLTQKVTGGSALTLDGYDLSLGLLVESNEVLTASPTFVSRAFDSGDWLRARVENK